MAVGKGTLLQGLVFCFGRSIATSLKGQLSKQVRNAGATTTPFANASVTHYVTEHWEAKAASVPGCVVTPQFIADVLEQESLLNEIPFLVLPTDKPKEEEFTFVFSFDEPSTPEPAPEEPRLGAEEFVKSLLANGLGNLRALQEGILVAKAEGNAARSAARPLPLQERDPSTLTAAERLKVSALRRAEEVAARQKQRREEQERREQEQASRLAPARAWQDATSSLLFGSAEGSSLAVAASHSYTQIREDPPSSGDSSVGVAASEEEQRRLAAKLKAKRKKKRALVKKRKKAALAAEKQEETAKKREAVRRNVELNAQEGKAKAAIMARLKKQQQCEERSEKDAQWAEKQKDWEAEQLRRLEEWEEQKKQVKLAKKAKKEAFLAQREKILAEDKAEKGRKLFVGKLRFDDIVSANKDNAFLRDSLIEKRKELYRVIFRQYGLVERFKEGWESGHFFVVFYSLADAAKAAAGLSSFEGRKSACEQLQNLGDKAALPKPNFYVRWPRNTNFSLNTTASHAVGKQPTAAPRNAEDTIGPGAAGGRVASRKPVVRPQELVPPTEYVGDWDVVAKKKR
mmetsp:Transcript_108/g.129  ORF Transcript_108/g.129 Transcript_108/m.129 type:complete len:572 (-) Transcript_108:91-1806(-)